MLGLAIFVRALGDEAGLTNGRFVGITDTNGRTILSAAFTMSLLVIIINSQEAIRAVPSSLREASFGIGGKFWYWGDALADDLADCPTSGHSRYPHRCDPLPSAGSGGNSAPSGGGRADLYHT